MLLKLKHLKLYGFMPFEDVDLDFDYSGYTLISGVNNNADDMAKSNGSGKSSLISDSILWILTGTTTRGTTQVENQILKKGTYAELQFDVDKDEYKVIRTKDYKEYGTNLKIFINGIDKSGKGVRDGNKLLNQYLPDLTSELISSVMVLGQGLPQKFTNNTPSGRKEILERLSKSDYMIEDIKNKLSKRKETLSKDLRTVEDGQLTLESRMSVYEKELGVKKVQLDDLLSKDSIDYTQQIKDKEIELEKISQEKTSKMKQVDGLKKLLEECRNEYLENLKSNNKQKEEIENKYKEEETNLSQKELEIKTEIKALETEIKTLESVKDVCPTCGQKLPHVHKVDISEKKQLLEEIKSIKLQSINQEIQELKTKKGTELTTFIKNTKDKEIELENKGKETKKKYEEEENIYNKILIDEENTKNHIYRLKLDKEKNEDKKQELTQRINELKTELEENIKKVDENNLKKDNIQLHLDTINKMTTITTRDFRGILLSGIIEFINKKAKEYSLKVFETDKLDFKLDGNNIDISYCGKPYENLSGGEKTRVDIIIQFAIRDMLIRYSNFSCNIIVLDELMDFLDEMSCQKVIEFINCYCRDIESVYFITHHGAELNLPIDNEIRVIKDSNGISRIEV